MATTGVEPRRTRRPATRVLVEGMGVVLVGALFAFVANSLSPRGLVLTRDYFPKAEPAAGAEATARLAPAVTPTLAGSTNPAATSGSTNLTKSPALLAQLQDRGLGSVEFDEMVRLHADPNYTTELIVFVDARNDRDYASGHIPRAHQLDHYRPEKYLGELLPVCLIAERIVVYCNGGDCEDSIFAATMLTDAGVPKEKLSVYAGGLAEWTARGQPVEVGNRGSGELRTTTP